MKNQSQIEKLEKEILKNKILYYQGNPKISDAEFDSLEEELKSLFPESKVLKMVGSLQGAGKKIKHKTKMLSLNKTYDIKGLEDWKKDFETISILKIDGVSCSLMYENGFLKLERIKFVGLNLSRKRLILKGMWKFAEKFFVISRVLKN